MTLTFQIDQLNRFISQIMLRLSMSTKNSIFSTTCQIKKLFCYLEITSCVEKSRFGNFFSPDLCIWRPVCKRRQSVRFEALQVFVGRPGRRGLFPRSHNNQLLIWENTNSGKRQVTPQNGNKQDSAQIYELPKN